MKMDRIISTGARPCATPQFPAGVKAAWRDPRIRYPLLAGETACVARAIASRVAEFSAGRDAARDALGMPEQPILVGQTRAPIWPAGWSGSISHSRTLCVAAVAQVDDCAAIGVDLEPDRDLDTDLRGIILTAFEDHFSPAEAIRAFSMKEAVYKALSPHLPRMLTFHDLRVLQSDSGERHQCELLCSVGTFARGQCFDVTCQTYQGHILSTCFLKRVPGQ